MRKLVSISFCLDIRDDFEKFKGSKLSSIFDLNYTKIKNISIANLVCSCIAFLYMIVLGLFLRFYNTCNIYSVKPECVQKFLKFFALFMNVLAWLSYIARFILSIILFYFIEKGDIEKFDEFLGCKNVKKANFEELTEIIKLRNCCIAFLILNIIVQGIDKIEKCFDCAEKYIEEDEKNQKEKYMN